MDDRDWLAERFEAHRPRLRAVAWRLLGSAAEADDAVQEAWLRLSRTDPASVDNLGGWLTTVVARVCLNQLRSRRTRPEEPLHDRLPERPAEGLGPDDQGADPDPAADRARQRAVVDAFLAASRNGDFQGLLALLDPEVVVRADPAAVAVGSDAEVRGAEAVAGTFAGRARAARPALVDGVPGLVWAQGGRPRMAFAFTVAGGRITEIRLLADPGLLARVALTAGDQG